MFLVAVFAPAVSADPVVVGGSVTLVTGPLPTGVKPGPFQLTGIGFSANVTNSTGGFGISPCSSVGLPPTPCTTANLSWNAVGTDNFGTYTINGVTVPIDVNNQLSLFFTGPTFVIPPELADASAVLVTAPFSFTGLAVIPGSSGGVLDLTGEGTVRLVLTQQTAGGTTGLFLLRAVYQFGPVAEGVTVQAVPEPMTLLLLGSGLAGVLISRKRRRSEP